VNGECLPLHLGVVSFTEIADRTIRPHNKLINIAGDTSKHAGIFPAKAVHTLYFHPLAAASGK
jgi:hypothetical protein